MPNPVYTHILGIYDLYVNSLQEAFFFKRARVHLILNIYIAM